MQLPKDFENQMKAIVGNNDYQKLAEALAKEPMVSVRDNCTKPSLADHFSDIRGEKVAWCNNAFYLNRRPSFTFDPLFHAGSYYVQEASSMFLSHILKTILPHSDSNSPLAALDMCAAPGGKSTLLRAEMPANGLLISNEPISKRAQILVENIQKQGHPNTIVTCNYPKDYARSGLLFDMIVCDVPCSGEGMFRKDQQAIDEWSLANVEKCSQLQREIVASAWQCLRNGGYLIYSTCTFNTREDEENIRWIEQELGGEVIEIPTEETWQITGSLLKDYHRPVYRFLPGKTKGEGLFMAVVRKTGESTVAEIRPIAKRNKKDGQKKQKKATINLENLVLNHENFTFFDSNDTISAFPKTWTPTLNTAKKSLKILHSGIEIATRKGRDIIPNHCLALSTEINPDAFPQAELSYDDAIRYLRKEAIVLDSATKRGYVLVNYKGTALGFVKNLGNRANNLYPSEWRIRKQNI